MPHIASATCSARLRRRAAAHLVDQRELEALDLLLGRALSQRGERDAAQLLVPGALDHGEAVAEDDRIGHATREYTPVLGPTAEPNPGRPRPIVLVACTPLVGSSVSCGPYKPGVVWSLVLAALAMVCTVAIPWLTGRAVDRDLRRRPRRPAQPRDRGHRRRARASRAVGHAPARRRPRVARRSSTTCATLLYAHLQKLELGLLRRPADRAADVARDRRPRLACASSSATASSSSSRAALTILLGAVAMFWLQPGAGARSR